MKRPFADKRPIGPFFQLNNETNTDPNYDVAFKKSGLDRTLCEEVTTFAQLKLERAIATHRSRNKETAFGILVRQDKVYFTNTSLGRKGSIDVPTIELIDQRLDEIQDQVGEGDKCLVHTHDRSAVPSRADVRTFLSSVSPDSSVIGSFDIPRFDCFSIIGVLEGDKAEILSWDIVDRPSQSEFHALMEEVTGDDKFSKDRREFADSATQAFSEYINVCRTEFELRKQVMRQA